MHETMDKSEIISRVRERKAAFMKYCDDWYVEKGRRKDRAKPIKWGNPIYLRAVLIGHVVEEWDDGTTRLNRFSDERCAYRPPEYYARYRRNVSPSYLILLLESGTVEQLIEWSFDMAMTESTPCTDIEKIKFMIRICLEERHAVS